MALHVNQALGLGAAITVDSGMRHKHSRTLSKTINLDLGCGARKQDSTWVGMDAVAHPGVDLVHDPLVLPWPLEDNVAATVVMHHLWPRIPPTLTLAFMAELHRICRHEARVFITGPFGFGHRFVANPTHINPANEYTFCYWDPTHPLYQTYSPPPFRLKVFERVPADFDVDFNVVLVCQKKAESPTTS